MAFTPATRTTRPLRMMIYGPSGSGKSTSAMRIATGIAMEKEGDKRIAAFDTENSLGILAKGPNGIGYDFDSMSPDKLKGTSKYDLTANAFLKAFDEAEVAGYEILIIDSMSHLWHTTLEKVDEINRTKNMGIGAWGHKDVKPALRKVVDRMLRFKGHVIVTLRSKTEWAISNERGKNVPQKVGTAPIFENGIEYEFDMVMSLSENHLATVEKDRFDIWQDLIIEKPGEMFGCAILQALRGTNTPKDVPEEAKDLKHPVREINKVKDKKRLEMDRAIDSFKQSVISSGFAVEIDVRFESWSREEVHDWLKRRAEREGSPCTSAFVDAMAKRAESKSTQGSKA